FGAKRSRGVHFFDEDALLFQALSKLCALRHQWIALRRGRQYVHEISGDGMHFGPPVKFGERLHTLVSWSRVVADHEMLVVFNTDEINAHELYSTLNPNLRTEGDELRLLFSYTPESGVEPTNAPRHALPRLTVERRHGVLCTRLALGPAGIAIYAAARVPRIIRAGRGGDTSPRPAASNGFVSGV